MKKCGTARQNGNHTAQALAAVAALALSLPANAGTWATKKAMPLARSSPAVESINGIVYVAGGLNVHEQASLQTYNPTANTWTIKSSMPAGRYSGDGAGVINGQLYVAGGWDNTSTFLPHNTLFVYDPASDTWATKSPMPQLSGCGATGVISSKLYVTTACNGFSGYVGLLDIYDPSTDTWTSLANSNDQHSEPAFGVINSKFYVAGGINNSGVVTSTLEVYNPVTNTWTNLASMPTPVHKSGSAALNGKLYVFGGSNSSGTSVNSVQIYDPITNTWSVPTIGLLPTATTALVGGAVDYGFIFAEGGATSSGTSSNNERYFTCPVVP